eukprot:TRINITY_DN421_c0_g1_i7.p1 TRINITY_DN421_c0_g1~~TRINITY_DN421_c0_g1_i7.p1  ORF type:complete len:325 (-),score=100.09 TRINITY_DN421_c0_g1_i7:558-1532(-)
MGCGGAKAAEPSNKEVLPNNFEENFELVEKISAGAEGEIWKVKNKETGEFRAVKVVKKPVEGESAENVDAFFDERDKLTKLNSPNVLKAYDAYEDEGAYYLVIDYLQGMNLLDYLGKTPKENLNEQLIANYLNQILNALAHCHEQDIIHGDLRPSNVVFADAENKTLKLIDFRHGDSFDVADPKNQDVFGPPGYAAPEVMETKKYIMASDIWSCGILGCYMISGELPYGLDEKSTVEDLFKKIKETTFTAESFKGGVWDKVTPECKKFIASMLNADPEKRLSAEEVRENEWLKNTTTAPLATKEASKDQARAPISAYVRVRRED